MGLLSLAPGGPRSRGPTARWVGMLMTTQALTEYAVLAASRTGAALGQAVGVVRGFVSEHFLLVTAALILVVFYLTVNVGRGR